MTATREFYLARVAEAAAEADAAKLANVAERARRSQAAWQAMADQIALTEARRARATAEQEERAAAAG
jgi:hypothetical protein